MATLTTALNTAFTPAVGDFIVQCSAGVASLERRNASGAPWVNVGQITGNDAPIVSNPVTGAQYQFTQVGSTAAVDAIAAQDLDVGANEFLFTGASAGNAYRFAVFQKDAATPTPNPSDVLSSASETTPNPDTTDPVLSGSITVSGITSGTFSTTCPVGSDNVGVVAYDVREDGGSWINNGASRTYNHTGKAAETAYDIEWSCRDASGRRSNILAVEVTTYPDGATGQWILDHPESFMSQCIDEGDEDDWFSWELVSGPASGTWTEGPYADGTGVFDADEAVSMVIELSKNGVVVGNFTVSLYDGEPDEEAPTLAGSITVSNLTPTGYDMECPAGSDNVGVTEYEFSLNAGSSWTDNGNDRTASISGRTPETTDQVRWRCYDAAGNVSNVLSASVDLPAEPLEPVLPTAESPTGVALGANGAVGSVIVNKAGGLLFWITTTGATATDGAILAGSSQPVTASGLQYVTSGGLTPETAYYNHFIYEDADGLRSARATSASFTTPAAVVGGASSRRDRKPMRNCMRQAMFPAMRKG